MLLRNYCCYNFFPGASTSDMSSKLIIMSSIYNKYIYCIFIIIVTSPWSPYVTSYIEMYKDTVPPCFWFLYVTVTIVESFVITLLLSQTCLASINKYFNANAVMRWQQEFIITWARSVEVADINTGTCSEFDSTSFTELTHVGNDNLYFQKSFNCFIPMQWCR